MSAAAVLSDRRDHDGPSPESRPTRAYSAAARRDLVVALGAEVQAVRDGRAYHAAACHLAEALEGEALRHAKVLAVLDLGRARACRSAAAAARDAANRFRGWMKWDPPLVQRQVDLSVWSDALRTACALGVDPGIGPGAEPAIAPVAR